MAIKARPYQEKAIQAVLSDWEAGYTDVLLTMATGGGKTFVFLSILDQVLSGTDKRGMVLAHRKELIEQPIERLYQYYPHWKPNGCGRRKAGIVMADINEPDAQLVVATVQTLASSERRLAQILSHGPIDYLVVDECHHNTNKNTYSKVLKALKDANPNLKHLGVTATPIRADGDGLAGVYQKESAHYGIVELIREGYLAPVRWLAIQTKISLADVKTVAGDFQKRGLANVFETANCFDLVVESHKRYASGRQAAAFTVTVDGAYSLAEAFNAAGIPAAAADGTTDKRERQRILDRFARGELQVLCNVALWTEGLDLPQLSCIHQVRPTKSDALYTQIIGRALRTYPGKEDALILDYCPAETRNIAMMGDVLGIPLRRDSYMQEKDEQGDVLGGFTFDGKANFLTGSPAEIISRQLDYLDMSPWSWYRGEHGWMSLGLGKASDEIERTLLISPPVDGILTLYGVARRPGGSWQAFELARGEWVELQETADAYCNRWGNAWLAAKSRSWRKEPPSDKQIAFAKRLEGVWKPGVSKGELAQRITHHLALRAVEQQKLENAYEYA